MRTILTMKHGSDLYGTRTASSDLDIKEVFIPPARDILLGRIKSCRPRYTKAPSIDGFLKRNTANDIDVEAFSLCKIIKMFCDGQTPALDMLFATPTLAREAYSDEWLHIWTNRERLRSKQCKSFLGYCKKQANKYGIKGSRVAAARDTANFLSELIGQYGHLEKLGYFEMEIAAFVAGREHMELIDIEIVSHEKTIRHLSVCQKKAPFTVTLKEAHAIYKRLFDDYGERARQAMANQAIDWKALSHAVRVGTQSIEYLTTGFITFPRPDAAHLLEIKQGKLRYAQVAGEIEDLLVRMEEVAASSSLPEKPDEIWCDDFICKAYSHEVMSMK